MEKQTVIRLRIIHALKQADKPLIAHHIAKLVQASPQLVDYHIGCMLNEGVLLEEKENGSKYYYLQPPFYMRKAEDTLLVSLTDWTKEFAKQIKANEKDSIVLTNLQYFLLSLLEDIKKSLE